MTLGNLFFLLCATVALVGAVGTVAARNPIRGAVGLLSTVIAIAGLFLQLHAQFLAAIQLIVYAGAVVVLFVFVIMLLGPDAASPPQRTARARASRVIGGVLFMLLALGALGLSMGTGAPLTRLAKPAPGYGGVESVGLLIFTKGLVPFELATALLIVAVVGAIAVARARHTQKPRRRVESPGKLFYGPLHPRDAGRPLPKESAS